MKETIIITSLKGNELLRSLAFAGIPTFNIRIFNSESFCTEALLRSGLEVKETISSFKQQCIVYSLLPQVDYFKDCGFQDAKNVTDALNTARKLCRNDEEEKMEEVFSQGEFKEKNQAILEVYKLYKNYLKQNDFMDSVSLINYTKDNALKMDAEFVLLEETPLTPLEEQLVIDTSLNIVETKKISSLFNREIPALSNVTYDNGYGSINELEHILNYIAENKIPFDQCVIASVDQSYLSQFDTLKNLYNIPVAFNTGVPFTLSTVSKLLDLIQRWKKGYYAIDALKMLLEAEEFNKELLMENIQLEKEKWNSFVKKAGNLRLSVSDSNDERVKDYCSVSKYLSNEITLFSEELKKGYGYLLETYTTIREELSYLDTAAVKAAVSQINEYVENVDAETVMDIFDDLQNKNICREVSTAGKLVFTDLNGALSIVRKHLFICGLSAKNYPGSPKENYLLLDSDLQLFNEKNYAVTSDKSIENKKKLLMNVVDNASVLGSSLHISYAGFSLSDLKEENPSSMVFEIYAKQHGTKATMDELKKDIGEQHRYFEAELSQIRKLGQGYMNGDSVELLEYEDTVEENLVYDGVLSPSSVESFFECPKRFYLKYVLKIAEPEENDPFVILPANDEGTLIHECMEDYGSHPDWKMEQFMANANRKLENYFKTRVPIHTKSKPEIERRYKEMAMNGFTTDAHKEVYASEKYLGPYTHAASGLKFGGIVDRIEKNDDGTYQIVDYKTYREIKNFDNDIETCLQVVLYCWLLEKTEGKKASGAEYRYLRNVRQVHCDYDEGIIQQMDNRLQLVSEAFKTGIFECNKDACKYCKYSHICNKEKGEQ